MFPKRPHLIQPRHFTGLCLGASLLFASLGTPTAFAKGEPATPPPNAAGRPRQQRVLVRPVQQFEGEYAELYRRVVAVRSGQEWLAMPKADRLELLREPEFHVDPQDPSLPANLRRLDASSIEEIRAPRMRAFAQQMQEALLLRMGEIETGPYYASGPIRAAPQIVYLDTGEILGGCILLRQDLCSDRRLRSPNGNYWASGVFQALPAAGSEHLFQNLRLELLEDSDYWEYDH